MKKIKRRYNSMYWQQFFLTSGLVLLTLVLLGVSFFALSHHHTMTEKRSEMKTRAELVARFSLEYMKGESGSDVQEDLRNLAGVATLMSDVNFLICNEYGQVMLTTDERLVGKAVTLPGEMVSSVLNKGVYEGMGKAGIYEQKQVLVAVPVVDGGKTVGIVVAVMDATELLEMWNSFLGLFLMTAAIVMTVAFVTSSLISMRQLQPIREMVQATRAYGAGNFDTRICTADLTDEIGELALSFNNMADSLAETERQRSDFIANISHELKTPMTTIAGYTDGILDGTIPPAKERQYLQIISDESRRLSRLVRRMLDISQIQSLGIKHNSFDLCESMRLSLLSMEQRILQRELDVDAQIPDDSVLVLGDNDLITQVIYNLLENATKFAAPGSTLYLGLECGAEKAVVTVRNQGMTIEPEEIPLLFERFHKSDKSRSADKDGYGLGLYVVKTILDQHKESITVTSEDGVTAFSFTIQLAHPLTLTETDKKH